MTTSRAFDLAEWMGVPAHPGDGITVDTMGPPFMASFKPVVAASAPGVTVGASIPAANAANQILVSSSSAGFPWALGTNPAVGATVPPPTAANHVLLSDATPTWKETTAAALVAAGGAVTLSGGGTFAASASLIFTPTGAMTTCIDGTDPTKSAINNFDIDAGTF